MRRYLFSFAIASTFVAALVACTGRDRAGAEQPVRAGNTLFREASVTAPAQAEPGVPGEGPEPRGRTRVELERADSLGALNRLPGPNWSREPRLGRDRPGGRLVLGRNGERPARVPERRGRGRRTISAALRPAR